MRFSSYLGHKKGSLCQAFLAEAVETGTKNRCVIEATHVCEESLGKNKFRAFQEKCRSMNSIPWKRWELLWTLLGGQKKKKNLNLQNLDGQVL